MFFPAGEIIEEEVDDDDDDDEEGDEQGEEEFMKEQQAKLEKEKEAILNNQSLIAEVSPFSHFYSERILLALVLLSLLLSKAQYRKNI